MNKHVQTIGQRLSLRAPQKDSLEILARVGELIKLEKGADPAEALAIIRDEFPTVEDFEREFPSLCFALATGVGKTRLMGAFITYLYRAKGIRHFFVLAPSLTIYNKLIADFTPNTPKYVFQGIGEFALNPPTIVTGDNYETGIGVREGRLFDDSTLHVNVFNVAKINTEVRGDKSPRIKRLSEYIGESYFSYLSKLEDLVLIMDEAHRYRASAGLKAINELRPIIGLELTATPQVEKGTKAVPFKNVIYSYPLSSALKDGFVKEPAVATRENFDKNAYTDDGLELLKLQDGVLIHEQTKVELEIYANENGVRRVKPFMMVVAQDTTHASAIKTRMEADDFFHGQYKGKVIEVHSKTKGEESEEVVQQLLSVEDPANPIEIVIHVNMLKEGWDVTNLYTIVPLRAANSTTLVEQSIGRGLRLPYNGKRTGVAAVDRLTIVSHDRFQEIVDAANKPDSFIRTGVIIGRDVPAERTQVVVVNSTLEDRIIGPAVTPEGAAKSEQPELFETKEQKQIAKTTLEVINEEFQRLPRSADLKKPEIVKKVMARVEERLRPTQPDMFEDKAEAKKQIEEVVARTIEVHNELSMDIPRIHVEPTGEVTSGYRDFDLDCRTIHLQPVSQEILIQHLHNREQHRLLRGDAVVAENKPEDYLVRGLIDCDDIDYETQASLLYKLAGQVVMHLRGYLANEEEVLNVLQAHQQTLVQTVYTQMQTHYYETATNYRVHVAKGFTTLRPANYSLPAGEKARDFRTPVDEKILIRGMLFTGFKKSLYPAQKFQSDTERRFSVIVENDKAVLKWFKPLKGLFKLFYSNEEEYVPDFAVETKDCCYLCEPKMRKEIDDPVVQSKARAASAWCQRATEHGGGKPWKYLLVPHDAIDETKTIAGLAATFLVK
ncbi:DEAD/DEAH box helicase family protein [soil metagenome]